MPAGKTGVTLRRGGDVVALRAAPQDSKRADRAVQKCPSKPKSRADPGGPHDLLRQNGPVEVLDQSPTDLIAVSCRPGTGEEQSHPVDVGRPGRHSRKCRRTSGRRGRTLPDGRIGAQGRAPWSLLLDADQPTLVHLGEKVHDVALQHLPLHVVCPVQLAADVRDTARGVEEGPDVGPDLVQPTVSPQ